MRKRSLILLFLICFAMCHGNEAYSDIKPMENPMPDKLLVPAGLLGIQVPEKLPSANNSVDMPKLADFGAARKWRPNRMEPALSLSSYNLVRSQLFVWPVIGEVSSGYGFRSRGIKGGSNNGIHEGIDIPMPMGTPILAARGGVVERADAVMRGYGNLVIIDHGKGLKTRYGHCSAFEVKKGDAVQTGQIIAYVGNSGRSTSAHLHFEVLLDGLAYNPMRFLDGYHSAFASLLRTIDSD